MSIRSPGWLPPVATTPGSEITFPLENSRDCLASGLKKVFQEALLGLDRPIRGGEVTPPLPWPVDLNSQRSGSRDRRSCFQTVSEVRAPIVSFNKPMRRSLAVAVLSTRRHLWPVRVGSVPFSVEESNEEESHQRHRGEWKVS